MSLHTYPSNRVEYLVYVLNALIKTEQKPIFQPTQLIVGNRGMQRWLSIELAQLSDAKIAMNIDCQMLNGFLLDIAYRITDKASCKDDYSPDVMTWRIYRHLDALNQPALVGYYQDSPLKKYQLSAKISAVFAKYINHRPEWLILWAQGQSIPNDAPSDIEKPEHDAEQWQRQLWQMLCQEKPDTPYTIEQEAIRRLTKSSLKALGITDHIYLFGINTTSQHNLDFLFELAKHIEVHILYVNPCCEFWHDVIPEKYNRWLIEDDGHGNRLLANLGQQGKAFIKQLHLQSEDRAQAKTLNISETPIYQDITAQIQKRASSHLNELEAVQASILELTSRTHEKSRDDTISIHACHSPLREVQVLHDRLLDIIKENPEIKPRDILVMCPNIETYVPYIDSVFNISTYEQTAGKLPCSIADRSLYDSEPLIAGFIELLTLPDSNFEVTQILDYLNIPAIQRKFEISSEQLDVIHYWLKEACIHHSNQGQTFSWSWGLKRLMMGFGHGDQEAILNDELLTVPVVEGSEIVELGGLYLLLDKLDQYTTALKQSRTIEQWQAFFHTMIDDFFAPTKDEQPIADRINTVIGKIVKPTKVATFEGVVDMPTIRYCLRSELSQPLNNYRFLEGRVTFCSMAPMRNLPFKVIAMLGLNEGDFPRKETLSSFDLMRYQPRKPLDRSQRDDDRYLFLEAILSARQYLYLSYIGNSIVSNKPQESSLLLKELIGYLVKYHGWDEKKDIHRYPLHPFSERCYTSPYQSYDQGWLKLIDAQPKPFYDLQSIDTDRTQWTLPELLTIQKWVNIFNDPLKAYANYALELYLDDHETELEDSEPFDINGLVKHEVKSNIFNDLIQDNPTEATERKARLSGKVPDSCITDTELTGIKESVDALLESAQIKGMVQQCCKLAVPINDQEIYLETSCYLNGDQIVMVEVGKGKIKHQFILYLTALVFAHAHQKSYQAEMWVIENDEPKKYLSCEVSPTDALVKLTQALQASIQMINQPMLSHLALAEVIQNGKDWRSVIYNDYGFDQLSANPYFKLFYPEDPEPQDFQDNDFYRDCFAMIQAGSK